MLLRMGKFISFAAAFSLSLAVFGIANADDEAMSPELMEKIAQNMPELVEDDGANSTRSSHPRMKCFVDTPAFDQFTYGSCFSVGSAQFTTAVFRIDNVPSNFTIIWSDSSCSSSSRDCSLPIRWYQTINLSATVLDNSNNTFSTTSATARYEGFF
ncbi:MAG: hypothetical protein Tsb002_10520 [Wenzhouxiangellaceae bacterium]